MEKAKVYFTSMRVKAFGDNLLAKLQRLMRKAGIERIDFKDRFAAIKIHFGEAGNLSFVRPNFARVVAEEVKKLGGHPFLTDCNTLYVGSRKHALEHIETAYRNGFTPYTTGCHIIIGDGLKGTDDVAVPVPNGEYVKEAKIGRAIMDADIFISLSHFKGHESTGFGGAIKNIGMGCGSRAGKMAMHSIGKPSIDPEKCRGCKTCTHYCAQSAISIGDDHKARIDHDLCAGCGRCIGVCNQDAIKPGYDAAADVLNCKIAEYTKAIVDGRPSFHISLAMDISPNCDCHAENDTPIVNDIGMFASFDPVAIDQACADAVLASEPLPNTVLTDSAAKMEHNHENLEGEQAKDPFCITHPDTDWRSCIAHAEKIGLGTSEYELIEVK